MEIKYKSLIVLVILTTIIFLYLTKNKKSNYTNGVKITNTEYIRNSIYFKNKLLLYKVYKSIINILFLIVFICIFLIIGKFSIKTYKSNKSNNNILLCMDASSSLDETNLKLVNNFTKQVDKLDNSSIGISIFNTSSALITPITPDHKSIKNTLKIISKSIKVNNPNIYGEYQNKDYLYYKNFIVSGTTLNYEERGTSLIGDGLFSCINSIDIDNNSKTIIFSTDNQVSGDENISLKSAALIANEKKIKIINIYPENIPNANKKDLMSITDSNYDSMSINKMLDKLIIQNKKINTKEITSSETPNFIFIILYTSSILLLVIKRVII